MSTRKKIIISILAWFFIYNPLFFITVDNFGVSENSELFLVSIVLAIGTYWFLGNKDKIFKKDKNKKVEESFAFKAGRTLRSSKILIYAVILIVGIAIGSNLISNNQSGNGERVRQLENKVKYLERNQTSAEKNARKIQAIRDCLMADLDTLMCAGVD